MKVSKTISLIDNKPLITVQNLKMGDIGVHKDGWHVLRTYDGFVQLEDPNCTWEDSAQFELTEILKKGDSVLLTIE